MPFQALPIAFRRCTGSPRAKLLLIYLVWKCGLEKEPVGGESELFDFDWREAADFCECDKEGVYHSLDELERLRLVHPDDVWLAHHRDKPYERHTCRWDFLRVVLPISEAPAPNRNRFKASSDQFDAMWRRDGYNCVACGTGHDDVASWHVDHIIPRSVGGADVEDNCQAICGRCNSRKGAKVHFVDFLGGRG